MSLEDRDWFREEHKRIEKKQSRLLEQVAKKQKIKRYVLTVVVIIGVIVLYKITGVLFFIF